MCVKVVCLLYVTLGNHAGRWRAQQSTNIPTFQQIYRQENVQFPISLGIGNQAKAKAKAPILNQYLDTEFGKKQEAANRGEFQVAHR